jgi:predicted phosphodiesterase
MKVLEGPVLLFGGCYSNLQATEALLDWAAARGIAAKNMVCTGDIIAYGADAKATLGLIRKAGIASIAGNCEAALAAGAADCGCGFAPDSVCDALAAAWYAHARSEIDEADRDYMARLPKTLEFESGGRRLRIVHGNVERINAFVFPSVSNLELATQIEISGAAVVVAGHCGIPFTRHVGDKIWHNPGSIGMPANDGTRRGWFSMLEVRDGDVMISPRSLDYDAAGAAAAMRTRKLPEGYAAALETGIWPSLDVLPAADRYFTGVPLERREIAERPPVVALARLETLWVNTGTLCNLACTNCFMESTPTNDALAYMPCDAFASLLDAAPDSLSEIGFTGGEPFMNPDIGAMLEMALGAGKAVLVLTNAMRPMRRHEGAIARMAAAYPQRLAIRVSLDHYEAERHDRIRGKGSFAATIGGLRCLAGTGVKLSVASRTPWGETEAAMRGGFGRLFAAEGLPIDALDPRRLMLFPEMDAASPALRVTRAALAAVPADKPLMCASARMAVLRKGETAPRIAPCTLLPAQSLAAIDSPVTLSHPHCAQFCVYGGASCAGAPG